MVEGNKTTHTTHNTHIHVYTIKSHVDILFLSEIKLDCFFSGETVLQHWLYRAMLNELK